MGGSAPDRSSSLIYLLRDFTGRGQRFALAYHSRLYNLIIGPVIKNRMKRWLHQMTIFSSNEIEV